jgi:UDP-N-acetylglucosamine 2-epimerase
MEDLQDSYNIGLQIICPTNHQNFEEINDKFGKSLCRAAPVYSIDDFGDFYSSCLNLLRNLKPSILLCVGDRFEVMAAATAALLLNIPIAHLHGGETTTGSFDDNIRNAITQMAQYHFASTDGYAMEICRMVNQSKYNIQPGIANYNAYVKGDTDNHIYDTGSPGLDWLKRTKLLSKQELQQYVSIDLNQPFIVACLHPETKNLEQTEENTREFLFALMQTDQQIVLIRPNIDPGNDIIKSYYSQKWIGEKILIVDNLDHIVYLSLLQYAELMVGNSSSGIIESASFDLPSVTVGNRQAGRIRGSNVFDCPCETEAILTAVDRAREWNATVGGCDNLYGKGDSSEKIIKVLEEIK